MDNGAVTTPTFRVRRASSQSSQGQIQVIIGPMFSGKSTELIRRLKRYQIARHECLIVKYARDVRYDEDGISTHDRCTLRAVSATKLAEMRDRARAVDVIGVDEGQFFSDVVSFCEDMANAGKVVIVAALDGTFQRKGFPNILELIPLAEHVVKLNAVCMSCFGEGSYTKRMSADKELEVIGGADKYMAACRRCFHSSSSVPASPRIPLKHVEHVANGNHANGEKNGDNEEEPPIKKALFGDEDAKENGVPPAANGAAAVAVEAAR